MTTCHHDSLGRQIYLTSQAMRNHIERLLKPFDLTIEQLHILKHIDKNTGKTQSEICQRTFKSPANITRILDRLEKKKLLIRRKNPEDRRSSLVLLTDQGAELGVKVANLFYSLSSKIEQNIKSEEIDIVKSVLGQIETNIQKLSEDLGE